MSGCAKAAIIGGAIILVGIVVLVGIFIFGLYRFAGEVEGAFEDDPCPYLTNQEASDAVGADVEAVSGDSALGRILGLVRDTRLLADAPACFISDSDSSIQIWVSVYDGSDAVEVFATGVEIAGGQVVSSTSTDSGTITVDSEPFRGADVAGLGDEAFCVDVGPVVSGGVFARSDDRVVFVSTLAVVEDEGADLFDGSLCERAASVARVLLG